MPWLTGPGSGSNGLVSISATVSRLLDRVTVAIERADVLDPASEAIDAVVSKVPNGAVKDLLSGVAVGHPAHPALVAVPIGALTGVVALDVAGDQSAAARRLVGLSLLSSVPAALAGLSDWSDTRGAERRVGLVHRGRVVALVDAHQEVAGLAHLVVGDRHLGDVSRHLGADRHRPGLL